MGQSISEVFTKGGWVMWPLLIFSIMTWAVVLDRLFVFLTLRPRIARLSAKVLSALRAGDMPAAKQFAHSEKPFLSEIFLGTLDTRRPRESAERVTERNRLRLSQRLKNHLWILGTIGSASPFVGLLGTVLGIIRAFRSMSEKGAGGFAVVSGGISEALIATAAGLIVAIIALIAYNIFVTAANQTLMGVRLALDEVMDWSYGDALPNTASA